MTSGVFRFRQLDNIGAAGAEEDEFLLECFVDTGCLAYLEAMDDRRILVVGRTGAGKSALLRRFADKLPTATIQISPENLALTYVSNSTILAFFSEIGVNLDPFFRLLWRHVMIVEILSRHFKGLEYEQPQGLLVWLRSLFGSNSRDDKEMREAIAYLAQWGKEFWLETEFRVKEITQKLETELTKELGANIGGTIPEVGKGDLRALAGATKRLSEEQKTELLHRGQQVVSQAQVADLQRVMELLDRVLSKERRKYYVLIDRLDEGWVEERLRYRMIMALLETAKQFTRIGHAKVVVALRRDLLERVFRLAREAGFQEEKYRSLYMPIAWSRNDLIDVLDRRIDLLVKRRYTKQTVTHRDLLPRQVDRVDVGDYLFARAQRPRDVIAFFNACIDSAVDSPKLNAQQLRAAEGEYSRYRLRALADEWSADYPRLLDFARILQKRPPTFQVADISRDQTEELCLQMASEEPGGHGALLETARRVVDTLIPWDRFRIVLVNVFYSTGLVGLKLRPYEQTSWVDEPGRGTALAEIDDDTLVCVHPAYHRALGVARR